MAALSVEPGTTPDTQSAASDQSPDWPVIQFCVVITRRSSVTSAIAEYLYDGHGCGAARIQAQHARAKRNSIPKRID
jgi:hypothetical protein